MSDHSAFSGGPAFPGGVMPDTDWHHETPGAPYFTGMTLRDWFAGQALAGIMAYPGDEHAGSAHNNCKPVGVAAMAYRLADAMIAAREEAAEA